MPCDLDEWVRRQLATAPRISQATRSKLAALLFGEPAPNTDEYTHRPDEAA